MWNNSLRELWNISLRSMWNEINPLTRRSAFHMRSVFHAQSAFHKSRKGFISLKKAIRLREWLFSWQGSKDSNSGHAVLETAALPTELHPYEESLFPETYSSVSYSFWKSKSFFQKSQNFCAMPQEVWKRNGERSLQQPKTALENSQRVHSFSFCRAVWSKPILPFLLYF